MFGECHAHIFMDGVDYRKAARQHKEKVNDEIIRRHFQQYKVHGITYVREGGDCLGVSQRALELASEYGICYRTPIFAIHRKGHYGNIVGRSFDTIEEYAQLVQEVRRSGGHFIKIMITGIMDFAKKQSVTGTDLPHEEVREMIHIAHQEGFAVMVHANGADAVRNATLCGADSIEHGYFIDSDCIEALAASNTVWLPTLAPVRNLLGLGRFHQEILSDICQTQQDNLQAAYQKGVKLALGSDAGAHGVKHAKGLLQEYEAFKDILGASENLNCVLRNGEKEIRNRF